MAATTTRPPVANRPSSAASPARDFLAEITTKPKATPAAMVLFGPPGIGKTSFGAAIPGCVFMHDDQEEGIHTLKSTGQVAADLPILPPMTRWGEVLDCCKALLDGEHNHKCLVIDTLGGCERLCHEFVCNESFQGEWGDKGFASYQKGYEVALPAWRSFLNALDKLRTQRGMRILFLAHSQVKTFRNPTSEDYDRYIPDCHHKTWNLTHKWADIVLFANYFVVVDKHGKGKGGQERSMYTQNHAAYEAKNRYNLPEEIPMGNSGAEAWGNLTAAIKGGQS